MAVSAETIQAMMMELQRQNMENMAILMKQLQGGGQGGGMTDTRGIGRPIVFRGDESKYAEWKAKLLAYLRVTNSKADVLVQWAGNMTSQITEEDVDLEYGGEAQSVKDFAVKFFAILVSCTEDDAFRICHSVKDGNGLEAMRLLMKRFEPKTPGTKRALLKAVINSTPAKKPEDIEKNLMHTEELMKRYEVLGGEPLPEDLRVTVIIDLCTKDLKEHLELITREMKYKEVRDEIMSYVERKRDLFGNQLKAMEVDNYEDESDTFWWGGKGMGEYEHWSQRSPEELYQMGYWSKGGKGSGAKGKGFHKGDNYYKGDKGGGKKGYKGDGKGKGGKGKGDGFQGNCHWCGEWGHSQSRCKMKDEYMENIRKSKGYSKGGHYADNVEDDSEDKEPLANLEASGGWRCLCSVEQHREPSKKSVSFKGSANRFAALQNQEDEDAEDHTEGPPGLTVGQVWKMAAPKGQKAKKEAKKRNKELGSLDSLEVNAMEHNASDGGLWITIDSGASENVISEELAPQVKVRPSLGSREGVKYVTANGETMANKGEKHIQVKTSEGHKCMLNMQVTDVKKPLMSVARICDAGHEVVFRSNGGTITHTSTGQTTKFQRVDNVYRLRVDVVSEPVFRRPGK